VIKRKAQRLQGELKSLRERDKGDRARDGSSMDVLLPQDAGKLLGGRRTTSYLLLGVEPKRRGKAEAPVLYGERGETLPAPFQH